MRVLRHASRESQEVVTSAAKRMPACEGIETKMGTPWNEGNHSAKRMPACEGIETLSTNPCPSCLESPAKRMPACEGIETGGSVWDC